jgi:hypothetical protein
MDATNTLVRRRSEKIVSETLKNIGFSPISISSQSSMPLEQSTLHHDEEVGDWGHVVSEAMEKFIDDRASELTNLLHTALFRGLMTSVCGLIFWIFTAIFMGLQYMSYALAFGCLGALCLVSGIVIFSLIPVDSLSFDDLVIEKFPFIPPIVAIIFIILTTAGGLLIKPYTILIGIVPPLILLVKSTQNKSHYGYDINDLKEPLPTTLVSLYIWIVSIGCQPVPFYYAMVDDETAKSTIFGFDFELIPSAKHNEGLYYCYLSTGIIAFIGFWLLFFRWMWQKSFFGEYIFGKYRRLVPMHATLVFWDMLTAIFACGGALVMYYGAYMTVLDTDEKIIFLSGRVWLVLGVILTIPPLTTFILGREYLFSIVTLTYNASLERQINDGGFIAELLTKKVISIGEEFWIHVNTEKGEFNTKFPETDSRRNWWKGVVIEINNEKEYFITQLEHDNSTHVTKFSPHLNDRTQLIDLARRNLRCIEFDKIKPELFDKSVRDANTDTTELYKLSRNVKKGEIIDFFISHSWNDPGPPKYAQIIALVEQFQKIHKRQPTFWFDKVCINQKEISDGLKVLPINITACSTLLVLYGPSYVRRLWCVWELFTLNSFLPESLIQKKIKLSSPTDEFNNCLRTFDIDQARCYDPNEENKLLTVISAVGKNEFNQKVRKLANYV